MRLMKYNNQATSFQTTSKRNSNRIKVRITINELTWKQKRKCQLLPNLGFLKIKKFISNFKSDVESTLFKPDKEKNVKCK